MSQARGRHKKNKDKTFFDYSMLFIVIFVLTKIFYSISLTFYDSMLNDITTEERMDEVSSYGYAWGYIGSCIPFLIAMVAYILGGGLSEDLMIFSPMTARIIGFTVTGVWWLLVTLPLLKQYKQIYYVESEKGEISAVFAEIGKTIKKIATTDKKVLYFLIAFFLYIDGVGTIIDNCINIGTDLGLPTVGQVVFLLATQVVAFGGSLVFAQLSKKFDTVTLILACIVGYFCVCIYALTLNTLIDFGISVLATNAALAIILFLTNDPVNYVRVFDRNSLIILGIQDLLLCLVCLFLLRGDESKRLYEGRPDRLLVPNQATFGQYIVVILFATGLSAVINMLTSWLPIESETYNSLESAISSASPIIQLTAICIIGPIAEELLFRGIIYRRLRDYIGTPWAAVLSGIIFGAVHGNLVQGIYAGLFGIVMALLYEHYGTIWIVIVVHIVNNMLASFADPFILSMPTTGQFVYSGICILCVCIFGWYIFGVHRKVNRA